MARRCHILIRLVHISFYDAPDQAPTLITVFLVIVVDDSSKNEVETALKSRLGIDISGFLGLGTNRAPFTSVASEAYHADFEDSLAGQYLLQTPQARSFTLGLSLASPVIRASNSSAARTLSPYSGLPAGVLRLVDADPDAISVDDVVWVTPASTPAAPSPGGASTMDGLVPLGDRKSVV